VEAMVKLENVVVVGCGTVKKKDLTGAVARITSLKIQPPKTHIQLLSENGIHLQHTLYKTQITR